MKILLRLWKESFRRVIPPAAAGILLSLLLFFVFRCYTLMDTVSPVTVGQLEPESMAGAWVEDEVTQIYAAVARESAYRAGELVRVNAVLYVIPCGDDKYMGMLVHRDHMAQAEALLSACDRAYLGLAGESVPALRVQGTVRSMDGAALSLYLAAAGGDGAVEQSMLPYYLDVDRLGGHTPLTLQIVLGICVVLVLAGIAAIVWMVTWGGQKALLAKAAEFDELPKMVAKLEKLYESKDPIGCVWLDSYYVVFQSGPVSVLCRPWDIAWVYRRPVRRTVFSWCRVSFRMMDGRRYNMWMREFDARTLLAALGEIAPGIELGWSRAMAREYRHDRASFIHHWEKVRADSEKK